MSKRNFSVVQQLKVVSDGRDGLVSAIQILMNHNSRVVGFQVRSTGKLGMPCLVLYWYIGSTDTKTSAFLAPLTTPETVADNVMQWLQLMEEENKLGDEPDTDGSCRAGWMISTSSPDPNWWDGGTGVFAYIMPHWIIYGK